MSFHHREAFGIGGRSIICNVLSHRSGLTPGGIVAQLTTRNKTDLLPGSTAKQDSPFGIPNLALGIEQDEKWRSPTLDWTRTRFDVIL